MRYRKKLDSLNILIKVVIKFNNKSYKLVTWICYSCINNKVKLYYEYANYYNE